MSRHGHPDEPYIGHSLRPTVGREGGAGTAAAPTGSGVQPPNTSSPASWSRSWRL
ncbi:hypothetical protein [Acetobacter nitrogenifigens]|uniref:hypothetical protein n=1 Tax=Acetobacter nitrogenifigens TaxID=285268 RepID=UPI0003F95D48|nr:hypothetical protein [Acetobacter nitrogenifigens]